MADITQKVADIRNATYGKDVRESIASGIEDINAEVVNTTAKQTELEKKWNNGNIVIGDNSLSQNKLKEKQGYILGAYGISINTNDKTIKTNEIILRYRSTYTIIPAQTVTLDVTNIWDPVRNVYYNVTSKKIEVYENEPSDGSEYILLFIMYKKNIYGNTQNCKVTIDGVKYSVINTDNEINGKTLIDSSVSKNKLADNMKIKTVIQGDKVLEFNDNKKLGEELPRSIMTLYGVSLKAKNVTFNAVTIKSNAKNISENSKLYCRVVSLDQNTQYAIGSVDFKTTNNETEYTVILNNNVSLANGAIIIFGVVNSSGTCYTSGISQAKEIDSNLNLSTATNGGVYTNNGSIYAKLSVSDTQWYGFNYKLSLLDDSGENAKIDSITNNALVNAINDSKEKVQDSLELNYYKKYINLPTPKLKYEDSTRDVDMFKYSSNNSYFRQYGIKFKNTLTTTFNAVTFNASGSQAQLNDVFEKIGKLKLRCYVRNHSNTILEYKDVAIKPNNSQNDYTFIFDNTYNLSNGIELTLTLVDEGGLSRGIPIPITNLMDTNISNVIYSMDDNPATTNLGNADSIWTGFNYKLYSVVKSSLIYRKLLIGTGYSEETNGLQNFSGMIAPKRVFVTANDNGGFSDGRHYGLPLYIDYMLNQKTDILFNKGKSDYYPLICGPIDENTDVSGNPNVTNIEKTLSFYSKQYNVSSKNVTVVSTKASVVPSKKPMVLCIGDSITHGYLSDEGNVNKELDNKVWWSKAKELFTLEDIDFNGNGARDAIFLGSVPSQRRTINIDYKGTKKTVYANAEGRGGWTLGAYLRWTTQYGYNQSTWDYLGLGDGSGTDYVGSDAQKELLSKSPESKSISNPDNPFYDVDKSGNIKFSIKKWLSRYRTLDDNGNRLTWGSDNIGSLVTQETLNTIDVGTPTHVVIQLGTNDFDKRTPQGFRDDYMAMINTIRSELPNAIIIMSLTPPVIGTYYPERYPSYIDIPQPNNNYAYNNAKYWVDYFDKNVNEENDKLFLMPTYFVTPSALAANVMPFQINNGEKLYKCIGAGYAIHPNSRAGFNWGYQLYSLIKYTSTI